MTPYRVRLVPHAMDDLVDIWEYLAANDSVERADIMLREIESRIESLTAVALRGSVPAELEELGEKAFRQLVQGTYRIVYTVTGQSVYVVLIADGRRDFQSLLQRRLLGG